MSHLSSGIPLKYMYRNINFCKKPYPDRNHPVSSSVKKTFSRVHTQKDCIVGKGLHPICCFGKLQQCLGFGGQRAQITNVLLKETFWAIGDILEHQSIR